jgi:hypothetical protein
VPLSSHGAALLPCAAVFSFFPFHTVSIFKIKKQTLCALKKNAKSEKGEGKVFRVEWTTPRLRGTEGVFVLFNMICVLGYYTI